MHDLPLSSVYRSTLRRHLQQQQWQLIKGEATACSRHGNGTVVAEIEHHPDGCVNRISVKTRIRTVDGVASLQSTKRYVDPSVQIRSFSSLHTGEEQLAQHQCSPSMEKPMGKKQPHLSRRTTSFSDPSRPFRRRSLREVIKIGAAPGLFILLSSRTQSLERFVCVHRNSWSEQKNGT